MNRTVVANITQGGRSHKMIATKNEMNVMVPDCGVYQGPWNGQLLFPNKQCQMWSGPKPEEDGSTGKCHHIEASVRSTVQRGNI